MICAASDDSELVVQIGCGGAPVLYAETIRVSEIAHFWSNTSFHEENRAREELRCLRERLNVFSATAAGWAEINPDFNAPEEIARFARRHVRLTKAYWAAVGRTASSMIVGPANFPTARNRKRMGWADNAQRAIMYHLDSAMKSAKRRAYPYGAPGEAIRSGDPDAIEKLRVKLAQAVKEHAKCKAINAAWRAARKPLPDDDAAWTEVFARVQPLGVDEIELDDIRAQMRLWRYIPNTLFSLANMNAEIRRIEDRIADLERMKAAPAVEADSGLGFTVRENTELARIQLVFPGKPADKVRAVLKANGFRWAPSEGAWQRHLNNAGRYAVDCVKRDLGGAV